MTKTEYLDIDRLTDQLKEKDSEQMHLSKRVTIFYGILGPIFFISVIYLLSKRYDDAAKIFAFNQFCYFIIWTIFFVFFRKNYLKLKNLDYSLPILEVLQNAKKRYKFWNKDKWILILGIIIMDIPITNRFAEGYNIFNILITQTIFFSVIGFALLIGYFVWQSKFKFLITNIEAIIEDIEKE